MLRVGRAIIDLERERWREAAAQDLAEDLLLRQRDRLAGWSDHELRFLIVSKSRDAERYGLFSRQDVQSFIETILFIAPALELTTQFREAVRAAPDRNQCMLHVWASLPPGFLSHLAVSNAPDLWLHKVRAG
jgi:hypothetical protein